MRIKATSLIRRHKLPRQRFSKKWKGVICIRPFMETNGINTFYEIRGEGKSIIFIHGGFIDHKMWEPQINAGHTSNLENSEEFNEYIEKFLDTIIN